MKLLGYYSCTGTQVSSAATNAVRSARVKMTHHHFGSHSAEGHVELAHFVSKPHIPQESSSRDPHRRADNTSQSLRRPGGRMPGKRQQAEPLWGKCSLRREGLAVGYKAFLMTGANGFIFPILILRHFCGFKDFHQHPRCTKARLALVDNEGIVPV